MQTSVLPTEILVVNIYVLKSFKTKNMNINHDHSTRIFWPCVLQNMSEMTKVLYLHQCLDCQW